MKLLRNHLLVTGILLLQFSASAQEMLGTTLGNYSGVNSIQLNPSALHNSKTYLDIQLLGSDLFIQNNALYMQKSEYRFANFFKSGYQWPLHSEGYGTEERIFYRYVNMRSKSTYISMRINGPAAMLILGQHAFAVTTSFRTVISGHKVPADLANFAYLGLNYQPQQNINYVDTKPFRISGMAWGEIGVTYAYNVYARGFDIVSAGISIKRLLGVGGLYVNTRRIDYIVLNDSTINIKNLDADMGISIPVNFNANTADIKPVFKGGGFGVDVGVTYQRLSHYHQNQYYNSLCSQQYEDYIYRIGFAVIDFGGIRFKNNAVKMQINNRSSYWEHVTSMKFKTINQILDTISYKFYGDTTTAYSGNSFLLWLPSALSVQFDYHYKKYWYVNASLIYGFTLAGSSLVRPAELSVTPRYETSLLEVSLPVSLYDWSLPRIGLALRCYGITIGTDKLGGFFNFSDFTGLDFYFSIKLFFSKGNCRIKGPVHCGDDNYKKIKY